MILDSVSTKENVEKSILQINAKYHNVTESVPLDTPTNVIKERAANFT